MVLGRPWASLFLETFPLSATIAFNDGANGVGIINRIYIDPATYLVRLNAPGFIAEEVEVILQPNEEASFSLRMQTDIASPVVLQSFPSGADVYLSSEWKGKTPLLLENAGVSEPFVVRKDNFSDYYGSIEDIENSILNFELHSSRFVNEDLFELKRKDMYNSITMLVVGVPFFLFGFAYDEKWKAIQDTDFPANNPILGNRFQQSYFNISTTRNSLALLSQSGIAVFGIGIVNMFVDMIEYVAVYDKM